MKDTNLFLIRHGDTGMDPWQQVPGDPISEWGRKEVERLAEGLEKIPIAAFFSSPYQRALDTARIVAAERKIHIDNRLREIPLWATPKDLYEDERRLELTRILVEAQKGIEDILEVVEEDYVGENVVFVCHGNIIRAILAFTLKMGLETAVRLNISTASVSILRAREETLQLSLFNSKSLSLASNDPEEFVSNYLD